MSRLSEIKQGWWRWPENKLTGAVPWFIILRRLPFFPLIFCGMAISWLGVLGAYGLSSANEWWKEQI
jgi:hypothetical protein